MPVYSYSFYVYVHVDVLGTNIGKKISCDRPFKLPVEEEDGPWYRRVFVYSPVVEFSKAEGELLERGTLTVDSR